MFKNNITFLGYFLQNAELTRKINELPDTIRLSIINISAGGEPKQITLTYKVQFIAGEDSVSSLMYVAYFSVQDDDPLFNDIKKIISKKSKEMNDDSKQEILAMINISVPFVRQSISNITNDFGKMILLPVVDITELAQGIVEFNRIQKVNKQDPIAKEKKGRNAARKKQARNGSGKRAISSNK